MSSGATMLLLGATGMAGTHTRAAALDGGFRVVGAARNPGEGDLACDVRDPRSLERAIATSSPDVIVNLAGIASVGYSLQHEEETFGVNLTGAVNLLDCARRLAPAAYLLVASSGEVYGAVPEDELPVREERPVEPNNPYAASKAAMEAACEELRDASGMTVGVARAFNHTGPGQADSFAASSFARQIAAAEHRGDSTVTLATGDLSPIRDFSDVRDVARAYVAMVTASADCAVNICSGVPTRLSEIVEGLADATRVRVETRVDPALVRNTETPAAYGSPQRLREMTGWEPAIPLAQTLGDLLDWWRARIDR
jgi:GDP-4-dehydro-6-deoxy-D-mannose reductase